MLQCTTLQRAWQAPRTYCICGGCALGVDEHMSKQRHAGYPHISVSGSAETQRGAQAAGFGPLQEGLVLNCSSALVRQLLASPPPPVRVQSSCRVIPEYVNSSRIACPLLL